MTEKEFQVFDDFQELHGDDNSSAIQEVMLELVEDENKLMLREVKNHDEVLVSIEFSDKVKGLLGGDVRMIGEHMIQAAMASVMHQQMSRWHANVYDEMPKRFS